MQTLFECSLDGQDLGVVAGADHLNQSALIGGDPLESLVKAMRVEMGVVHQQSGIEGVSGQDVYD